MMDEPARDRWGGGWLSGKPGVSSWCLLAMIAGIALWFGTLSAMAWLGRALTGVGLLAYVAAAVWEVATSPRRERDPRGTASNVAWHRTRHTDEPEAESVGRAIVLQYEPARRTARWRLWNGRPRTVAGWLAQVAQWAAMVWVVDFVLMWLLLAASAPQIAVAFAISTGLVLPPLGVVLSVAALLVGEQMRTMDGKTMAIRALKANGMACLMPAAWLALWWMFRGWH